MIPPLARRFVAGETAAGGIDRARVLDDDALGAILNLLGEHYERRAPADADTAAYLRLLEDLAPTDLRACVSVKPTQLGLGVAEPIFRENLARLVARADETGGFVWLDMEGHDTVDATLDAFEEHARAGRPVGVAIQANLRRTGDDLDRLVDLPGKIRLVKGAYSPPADVAYRNPDRVDEAFRIHLRSLFETMDGGIAVGSHDPAMLDLAAGLHDEFGTPYEVQMLMGVREDAQRRLAADREVWQYVPYGDSWLSYFYRRVTERRANLRFAIRALVPW